jgi:hypothetical protein
MAFNNRPKTAHGRRRRTDESIRAKGDFYDDPNRQTKLSNYEEFVDQSTKEPLNAPPVPCNADSSHARRRANVATDPLQSLSWKEPRKDPRRTPLLRRNVSTNEHLQLAKNLQTPPTNGTKSTTPRSHPVNNFRADSRRKRDSSQVLDEEKVTCDRQQQSHSFQERHRTMDDYLNLPIPRKSSSSTSFDETQPNHSGRRTQLQAGKVLDLCDGKDSDTELESSSSSNRPADAASNFTIDSQPSSASSSDRSLCNSPAPERPTPPVATHDSSSTISSQKEWQPPCIELHDDDDEPSRVDTPSYLDILQRIEHEPAVLTTTAKPFSQSPSRSFVVQHVESAVALVQKTCSSFFTKVNAPKSKPQNCTFNAFGRSSYFLLL